MKKVQIFGILNVTPDSFSDGGLFLEPRKAIEQARKLFVEGADFIDMGGESTRPGAPEISPDEEWDRVGVVLKGLIDEFGGEKLSLDSRKPEVAQKFLKLGGGTLNDVSGFQNSPMIELAAEFQPFCIVNHFPGTTIFEVHEQETCSMNRVIDDLLGKAEQMIREGVEKEKIILDPGIGFGKTMALNWELLKFAEKVPNFPVLIGHSRKRFLGDGRFEKEANIKAAKIAVEAGTQYLRVHDPEIYKL